MASKLGKNFLVAGKTFTKISAERSLSGQICGQLHKCCYSSQTHSDVKGLDPEAAFIKPEVQEILKKVTGFDLDRIFKEKPKTDLHPPKYRLLTDKQVQEFQDEAIEKGRKILQMPPVLKMRTDETHVLSEDPEIADFNEHRVVFTDITYGVPKRKRVIVVRETDGTLRTANNDERDRMLQIYYPEKGKYNHMPKLFEEQNLLRLLMDGKYEYVLDFACIQFEPDHPEYIRVTQRTYEHIANRNRFDDLRSTRHFGVMTFYLAHHHKIEGLLVDMIQRQLVSDAADTIRLYNILHPSSQCAKQCTQLTDDQDIIQTFATLDGSKGGKVELALQAYNERGNKSRAMLNSDVDVCW